MGYNSTFSGSFTPNKPIPDALVQRINDASLDVRVAGFREDYEPGDVVPYSYEMHGYDFVEDTVKVQRLLARHGIRLSGSVERSGESGDDFDMVECRNGKVYYRSGEVRYGKREERGVPDVTRYAIRVFARGAGGGRGKFLGWATAPGLMPKCSELVPPHYNLGKPITDRPPFGSAIGWKRRDDANKVKRELAAGNRKRIYDIVAWEDSL